MRFLELAFIPKRVKYIVADVKTLQLTSHGDPFYPAYSFHPTHQLKPAPTQKIPTPLIRQLTYLMLT